MPQGWEGKTGRIRDLAGDDDDQYSLGSSTVVTLRSHSVMTQTFRLGPTS